MTEPVTAAGRALLAELDEFYAVAGSVFNIATIEQEARDQERARIAALVSDIPKGGEWGERMRLRVLAVIEGSDPDAR